MFGWKTVGEPYRSTTRRYGATLELHDNGFWLSLFWGKWRLCAVRYNGKGRFTGPEENQSVLAYFLNGADKRPRGRAFDDGFSAAAKKPLPRKAPRYAER